VSPLDDRLSRALDRMLSGEQVEPDDELQPYLRTAAYLRESLPSIPAPEPFRSDLLEWLEQPRQQRWWEELMGLRRRLPERARVPALGAAIGLGAAAAITVGWIVIRQRRVASITT